MLLVALKLQLTAVKSMDQGLGIMSRQLESYGINILQLHVEWLLANGYKQQASSCKRQIRMILKKQQATSCKLDKYQAGW
jgi:hypothetical protein